MGDPKTVVAVLAADHVFGDGKKFAEVCDRSGIAAATGEIVSFGIAPDHPATGYGYVHLAEPLAVDPKVRRIERPAFVEDGYLWNSGNFAFRADMILDAS